MSSYQDFIPELMSSTLFQNIDRDSLIALLDVMKPEIVLHKTDSKSWLPIDMENGIFCVVLKGKPLEALEPRLDEYNMPKYGEPGMMMGEIPCLSEMLKSRAPKRRPKGIFAGGESSPREHDLHLLLMTGEMVTKHYGEQYAKAQSIMMRNFLGILAQKVTDIRKEKSQLAAQAEKLLAPYRLNVFCAGVSMKLVEKTADRWNSIHPDFPVIVTPGGSVDLIRECISGDPCDLLISADDAIIHSMMMPDYTYGYRVWAGNRMVVVGDGINDANWEEKLLADDATFKHHNPYGDPGGYRAVMSMLLADTYRAGLSQKLMNHKGHIGMDKNPGPFGNRKAARYEFGYYSGAKLSGKDFAVLPSSMDLSDPALSNIYGTVSFSIDEKTTVRATAIAHALTIPKTALHKHKAKEFAKIFLEIDKSSAGFLPREEIFGQDPIK